MREARSEFLRPKVAKPSSSGAPLRDDIHAAPLHPIPVGNSSIPHRISLLKKFAQTTPLLCPAFQTKLSIRRRIIDRLQPPGFVSLHPGLLTFCPSWGRDFVPSAFCFCWLKTSFQASVLNSKFVIQHSSSGAPLRDDIHAAPLQL